MVDLSDKFESKTQTSTTGVQETEADLAKAECLGLVIVAHPDASRIGEEAPLSALLSGREVAVSRRDLRFLPPGREVAPRILEDSHLSRRPFKLAPAGAGEVLLDPNGSPTSIRVGDELIRQPHTFKAEQIENGVVIILAGCIALLLQPLGAAARVAGGTDPAWGLAGHSSSISKLRREIRAAALLDVPVLLRGETGSGKELVARAVHDARGGAGPYLAVNLGGLVPALAAAELFGATRGAYTGADRRRDGYFRRAHGGTLFLDEIGEAPIEVQVMLLRTLETARIQAVGAVEEIAVDVRVIAATDADLETAISAGRFRPALLHRLAGYEIEIPPLRRRRDDVARLLMQFLAEESSNLGSDLAASGESWPSAKVMARLVLHDWPGNVRELKNVSRRLAVLHHVEGPGDPTALLDQLLRPLESGPTPSEPIEKEPAATGARGHAAASSGRRLGAEVSEEELLEALERHDWRPGPVARALGLSRPALYRLIEQHPELRTANELSATEIERALGEYGNVVDAARALKVSSQGLKRRITSLGLGRD